MTSNITSLFPMSHQNSLLTIPAYSPSRSDNDNDSDSFKPNYQPHNDYVLNSKLWQILNICDNGEIQRYAHIAGIIPPPGHFDSTIGDNELIKKAAAEVSEQTAINSQWTARAKLYAAGGQETNLTKKTKTGLASMATQYEPLIELPDSLEYLKEEATADKQSLSTLYKRILSDILVYGRLFVLADVNKNNKFYLAIYNALNVVDWGSTFENSDEEALTYVITVHYEVNPNFNPIDATKEPKYIKVESYHYIDINSGASANFSSNSRGVYRVKRFKSINDKYIETEEVTPSFMGKEIDFIPGTFIGATNNTTEVSSPPFKAIAEAQIGIYQATCRLNHALANSAEPFLVATGADPDDVPDFLGAGSFMTLPDPSSNLKYVQPDSGIFKIILEQIDAFYQIAQEQGANILGSRKNSSESGEALRLRQSSITAPLKLIVTNVSNGIEKILKYVTTWAGTSDTATFDASKEFSTFALTANETVALIQAWQAQGISHSTLLENFRKAGMLKPGESVEDELATLANPKERWVPTDASSGGNGVIDPLDVGEDLPNSTQLNKNVKR